MARPYSQKFLLALHKNETASLGIDMAKLCVECNLPASYVSKALDVSRMTVYSWFRGRAIRVSLVPKVEAFVKLVREDMAAGHLPAKTPFDAKIYLDKMTGAAP